MIVLFEKEFEKLRDCVAMIGAHLSDHLLREGASAPLSEAVCEVARAKTMIRKLTPQTRELPSEGPNYFFQRTVRIK